MTLPDYYQFVQFAESKTQSGVGIRHVVIPAGQPIPTCSTRTALYGGHDGQSVVYDHDTLWHQLYDKDGVWMTDFPIEQFQMRTQLRGVWGDVLVGGLGLGIAVKVLLANREVDRIVVVENNEDVIRLVGPTVQLEKKVHLVQMDLFDYLREGIDATYDHAFFDIWRSDSEDTFHNVVMTLKRAMAPHIDDDDWDNIKCWNEDVMRGQLIQKLVVLLIGVQAQYSENPLPGMPTLEELCEAQEGEGSEFFNWAVPFWQYVKHEVGDEADAYTRAPHLWTSFQQDARNYVAQYGTCAADDFKPGDEWA